MVICIIRHAYGIKKKKKNEVKELRIFQKLSLIPLENETPMTTAPAASASCQGFPSRVSLPPFLPQKIKYSSSPLKNKMTYNSCSIFK